MLVFFLIDFEYICHIVRMLVSGVTYIKTIQASGFLPLLFLTVVFSKCLSWIEEENVYKTDCSLFHNNQMNLKLLQILHNQLKDIGKYLIKYSM